MRATGESSDAELLRKATAGNESAFTVLVERYIRATTLLAAQLVGDRDDAEDIVQHAFIVVLERARTFDASRPFGPWFYGIVRRLAHHHVARAQRRQRLRHIWRGDAEASVPTVDAQLDARAELETVMRIAKTLPEMQCACFELVAVRGLSPAEVAAMHDISESTVRQHVFRARQSIAASIGASDATS